MAAEWQTCTDVEAMLDELRDASPRKLRLFSVACCRPILDLIDAGIARIILGMAEGYADGRRTVMELAQARRRKRTPSDSADAFDAVTNTTSSSAWGAAVAAAWSAARAAAWAKSDGNPDDALRAETIAQCELVREIFGNPFRPLPPRPVAIAPLAEEIYGGKWELMPLLGEWLQEHGFWEIGEHCLDPEVRHVKGCWVVDWVLGME